MLPNDDVIFGQNPNIQLVCAKSAIKFNIWDVVSIVLSLIIMSSEKLSVLVYSQSDLSCCRPIMSLWHQMFVVLTQPVR